MTFGLIDILKLSGFDPNLRTRLVRHQDRRHDIQDLRLNKQLEVYQSYQSKPRFHHVEQIVSFYGLPGTRAGFYGVYKVRGHKPASKGPILQACDWSFEANRRGGFYYDLERDPRFDSLRDRLIIDWGRGAINWVRKLTNKTVLEIQAPGRKLPPFVDYLEFSLSHMQLKGLFDSEDAHADWRSALSTVGGVYLILAETSGNQYVGSAYGAMGIWGRWRDYAKSGHGDNVELQALIKKSPADYPKNFRFSVLQILSKTMAKNEVIRRETRYQQKLGSRATGLNS